MKTPAIEVCLRSLGVISKFGGDFGKRIHAAEEEASSRNDPEMG